VSFRRREAIFEERGVTSAIFDRIWIEIDQIEEMQTLRPSPVDFTRKLDQKVEADRFPLT
jgi:hypothetical protein